MDWNRIKEIAIFYFVRFSAVFLGFYIGYLIVKDQIKPNVLDNICLTNTENCTQLEIYRWKNTFVMKEEISQIWMFYDGLKLYIYGLAPGECEDNYVPVNVFKLSRDPQTSDINFTQYPNECIESVEDIITVYTNEKKVEKENVFMSRKNPNGINTVFSIIENMLNNKIFEI